MELQIGKWGNSLALRIPKTLASRVGLRQGEHVQVNVTSDGVLTIRHQPFDRKKFADELHQSCQAMPKGKSVMEEMRRGKGVRY